MTDAPHHHADALKYEDWAGEMGARWLANLTGFVSPAYLAWTVSGELIAMVVLGGAGTVLGPLLGAVALLLVEEGLKLITEHWHLILGPLILVLVLVLRNGLAGLLAGGNADEAGEGKP